MSTLPNKKCAKKINEKPSATLLFKFWVQAKWFPRQKFKYFLSDFWYFNSDPNWGNISYQWWYPWRKFDWGKNCFLWVIFKIYSSNQIYRVTHMDTLKSKLVLWPYFWDQKIVILDFFLIKLYCAFVFNVRQILNLKKLTYQKSSFIIFNMKIKKTGPKFQSQECFWKKQNVHTFVWKIYNDKFLIPKI